MLQGGCWNAALESHANLGSERLSEQRHNSTACYCHMHATQSAGCLSCLETDRDVATLALV